MLTALYYFLPPNTIIKINPRKATKLRIVRIIVIARASYLFQLFLPKIPKISLHL